MAKYVLINTVTVRSRVHYAGDTIDDAQLLAIQFNGITTAGGILVAVGNPTVDAASAKVQAMRKNRAADENLINSIMMSALSGSAQNFVDAKTQLPNAGGAAMTDADEAAVLYATGAFRTMVVLTANRNKTLSPTGAVKGNQIEVLRAGTEAFTCAFINGGPGAGTMITFPVSKAASAKFQFDGTNWFLKSVGTL